MISFDPYDVPIPKRHQYITGSVGPRPICWASTVNEQGEANLAPYSFFNAISSNPPMLVFSSNRRGRDNTTKDTLHNIEATMEVVINVVPHRLVNQMNISSTDYSSEVNEFEKAGVTGIDSKLVKPQRVKESPVQFECKVKDIITFGEIGGSANLFICEIVQIHIDESILDENEMIDPQKIDLVGRMGKEFYVRAKGEAIFEINNPFSKINIGFDGLPKHIVESKVLTGNEIAQLAMETELPNEETILAQTKGLNIDKSEREAKAKSFIQEGDITKALCILIQA
ncbi:MAG: flavin reductase (DIM6/NTAB) family NADH-FMN oxidoreductase RutF [Chitinophagales bacterium]|jgi:flavin reductase (DIM6/NTAB) family NADH-FMN oxidoreductase RutF